MIQYYLIPMIIISNIKANCCRTHAITLKTNKTRHSANHLRCQTIYFYTSKLYDGYFLNLEQKFQSD